MAVSREDRRRQILDAAVRVFAQKGFTQCRVSDIAEEAGVAYGLVYHYFGSKDEVLDTLFLERWKVLVELIADIDRQEIPARDKLYAIASFIVDSYRHDPDLMKVIIVEVTRAANSFGQTHLEVIREAYAGIAAIVERAQEEGAFTREVTPQFAALAFYGVIEQVLTGWIFDLLPSGEDQFEQAEDPACEHLLDRAVEGHGGELGGHRRAELAARLRLLDDALDLAVGVGDRLQVGGAERVRGARDLDDDHLHQLGVVAVGVDDERGDGVQLVARGDVAPVDLGDRLHEQAPALEEQRVEHLVLGAEVVVDEPVGDARLVGDVRHAAGVEALAREHAHRGVEDDPALVDGGLGGGH